MKNGRDHQSTPQGAFDFADRRWGPFTIDAAASIWNAKCRHYLDEECNGLAQPWFGRVWLNPPWACIEPWVEKAISAVFLERTADCVVMLLPTRTDQAWFHTVRRYATEHLIRGRLKFDPPPGQEKGSGGFEGCAFYVFERPIEARDLMRASSTEERREVTP